ncbi:MAG: hypothetical protein KDK78_05360, partial [Chlamydiia bacterium]|nr:hypothetical protein [Chlamydiia bacterium]
MTLTLAPPTLANAADVHLRIATMAATSQQLQTEAQELHHKLQERIAPLAQRHLRCMELQEEAAKVSEAPIPERTDLESIDYVTLTSRDGKRCKLPFHLLHAYAPRVANIAYPKLLHGLPAEMAMDVDGNSLERFSEIVNPCIPDALSNWNTWQEGAAALELLAAIQSYTDDESFFSSCQSRLKKRADTFKAISLEELEAWLMAATKLPSLGTKRDLCNLAMQCYSASPGSQVYVHYQRKEGRWQTRLEL